MAFRDLSLRIGFGLGLIAGFAACATSASQEITAAREDAGTGGARDTRPASGLQPGTSPMSPGAPAMPEPGAVDALGEKDAGAQAQMDMAAAGDVGGGGPAVPNPDPAAAGSLETLTVPGTGAAVTFKTSLAAGELYLLRAIGVVDVGGSKQDAEFAGEGAAAADLVGAVDVGIDVGLLQIHAAMGYKATPDGPGRMKWFGAARADHTYYMTVTGAGKALALKFVPGMAAAANGSITVALFALSPAPPKLAAAAGVELEMVRVPVLKVTNSTTLTTKAGAIYLLQAAGAGGVGGGGLKMGDADYMDWTADGTNKNEGEGGVDFGIGVDEPLVGKGVGPNPRLRWWGPWRMDHIYYMLFVGTGKPISFTYHDTGYGDNSKTDALTVKVFAAP